MELKILPLGNYQANCYCLEEEEDLCIIDPGDEAQIILDYLKETGKTPKYILLTHGHYDHTGAVVTLHKHFPEVPVYLHKGDQNNILSLFPINAQPVPLSSMENGENLPFGNSHITVHHTPGHSKGSVVYQYERNLFTGDTLFLSSMGRTDFQGGDYEEMMTSLKKLAKMEGEFKVYPGHDRYTTLETERKNNSYLKEAMRH